MINLTVLYPYSADKKFDREYWLTKHKQLVMEIPELKSLRTEVGLSGMGSHTPPAFFAIAHLTFESIEALNSGLASAEARAAIADNPNYTDVIAISQISEVAD